MLALFIAAVPISAQMQRSFGGETVHVELSAGTYRITGSDDGRIRVVPRTKTDHVSVRLNVGTLGRRADVKVTGPNDGFDADIELPRRVNIVVTLAGGTLHLRGIDGNKNISGKSGEIEIELGNRNQHGQITASVRRGQYRRRVSPTISPPCRPSNGSAAVPTISRCASRPDKSLCVNDARSSGPRNFAPPPGIRPLQDQQLISLLRTPATGAAVHGRRVRARPCVVSGSDG